MAKEFLQDGRYYDMNQPQDEAYRYVPLFESWQIDEKIGEGSYGVVYKVSKREMGETYDSAMKVISVPTKEQYREVESSFGGDERAMTEYFEDIVKNIVREIKMLYSLGGNANIIGYQDHKVVKKQDGLGWEILIRMEYVTSLRKYQKEHSMTREDVMRLGIDICSALETCSKKGIVHRDIKDDNIFVSDDGVFKLGDFGIARELSKSGRAASMRGTPLYMAPEIYRGDKYDAAVDIYSLGIVLYKMLNYGRMPLTPPYPEKMRYQDSEDALELRMSGASLPNPANAEGVLPDIVLKACAYSVQDRYASPAAMKADMLRALASMSEVQKQQVVLFATEKGEADLESSTSTIEEKAKDDESIAGGTIGIPVDKATDGASSEKPQKHDSTIGFSPNIDSQSSKDTPPPAQEQDKRPKTTFQEIEKKKSKRARLTRIIIAMVVVAVVICACIYGHIVNTTIKLGGISFRTNVTTLDLSDQGITDISLLSACYRLTNLDLSNNPITNIDTLASISTLEKLNLSSTMISDIEPLATLQKLDWVDITDAPVTDISTLSNDVYIKTDSIIKHINLGLGDLYNINIADFGIDIGGRSVTWTNSNTIGWVENGHIKITGIQEDISQIQQSNVIFVGEVENTNFTLKYSVIVTFRPYTLGHGDVIHLGDWYVQSHTISPAIENCYGFTIAISSNKVEEDARSSVWDIFIKRETGWFVIISTEIFEGVEKTVSITFNEPVDFSEIALIPQGHGLLGDNNWYNDISLTNIIFSQN